MGSEDSIPISEGGHQNLPAFTDKTSAKITTNNDYELLIVIRGQRNTGKTSLIHRMQGKPFKGDYIPNKMLSAAEFVWTSPKQEKVRITVWDVVEHALLPDDIDEKIEYPDATTVDTFKRADGVVIMIDSRFPDTIKLASNILRDAPEHIPIAVFSNFQDSNEAVPTIPKPIKQYMDRFTFIVGSMKSNLGLTDLSEWIALPLAKVKSNLYLNKYNSLMEELNRKILDFTTTAEFYVDFETARQRMPKPAVIGHNTQNKQNSQQQQNQNQNKSQRRPSESLSANDENGFWSDDDEDAINIKIQQKIDNNNKAKKNTETNDDDAFVPNPMVKRRVVKKSSSQNLPDKASQDKPEEKSDNQNTKPQPQIKQNMVKIEGNIDDDFFNDDDDEEQKVPENVNLKVLEEEDDEPLRPNPLVESIKSKRTVKPQVKKPNNEQPTATKEKNEPEKKENKETENSTKPIIPTIKVENENDENENNGFFDDDDDNENELNAKIATPINNDSDDDEELKPNPLVSSKPVPRIAPKTPSPPPQKSEPEVQNKPEEEKKEQEQEQKTVTLPTIQAEELGGNENDGFFDDDDNEENENNAQNDTQNKDDEDEEELKPNPLVSSKPSPKSSTPPPEIKPAEENQAEKEEEPKQQQPQVSLPTIDAGEVDNDFFKDDENENKEKVDDGFFDDEDENETAKDDQGNEAAGDENEDDEDDAIKPNPLVASNIKSKLQSSIANQQKEIQNQSQPQPETQPAEAQPFIPDVAQNEERGDVDDFFNDDDDDQEQPQSANDYADIGGGYDEMNNESEASNAASSSENKKPRKKKIVKRKKKQEEEPAQPSPEASGDYESI